ncbi:MAG TPA: amidohydrolase family protein, partial [Gemmatimonadales bacterium]|nr:amidohydrolase family protein [Gemmatimonadales bacterium]
MPAVRLTAGWVLPVDGEPIPCGAVLVGPDGFIERVGPAAEVPEPSGVRHVDEPASALVPGLVNTHTHLELTEFDGLVPDDDFVGWIARLRALKEERSTEAYLEAAKRGVRDCWASGVTTVADTGDRGVVARALSELGASGVVYQEVFGPHPDQCEASFNELRRSVEAVRHHASDRIRIGVSPHAPFTVSRPLYRAVSRWARSEGLPIALHLAESTAEVELVRAASGPFADAWRRRGIPLPAAGPTPVQLADDEGALGPDTLCIHAVQVDAADVERLRRAGAAIAHCPRANRRHGHGTAPLGRFLAAGLRVGVGTDSVASVTPLDLFAEAREAQAIGGLEAADALALCTLGGARALGLEREIGTLTAGKRADIAIVDLVG